MILKKNLRNDPLGILRTIPSFLFQTFLLPLKLPIILKNQSVSQEKLRPLKSQKYCSKSLLAKGLTSIEITWCPDPSKSFAVASPTPEAPPVKRTGCSMIMSFPSVPNYEYFPFDSVPNTLFKEKKGNSISSAPKTCNLK